MQFFGQGHEDEADGVRDEPEIGHAQGGEAEARALLGIVAMLASVVVFIFNDALIKLAAETVPSVQSIGVRGLFATLWCALALLATGAWRKMAYAVHPRVLLRGGLEAGAAIIYLIALFQMQIDDAIKDAMAFVPGGANAAQAISGSDLLEFGLGAWLVLLAGLATFALSFNLIRLKSA